MVRVTYSRKARSDMSQIWALDRALERRADEVIARIAARISTLEDHPLPGPAQPEIDETARMLVVMRWIVVCSAHEDNVRIVRVLDAASDVYRRLGKSGSENDAGCVAFSLKIHALGSSLPRFFVLRARVIFR